MISARNYGFLLEGLRLTVLISVGLMQVHGSASGAGLFVGNSEGLEFQVMGQAAGDCSMWQGTYDYAGVNPLGQLVTSAGSSPCDPSACCCWESFVRVSCEYYGGDTSRLSMGIDNLAGHCPGANFYNEYVTWAEVDIQSGLFTLSSSNASIGGTFNGAMAKNVGNLDYYVVNDVQAIDSWDLYFYVVNGSLILSARNQASARCSAMFTQINSDPLYDYPSAVTIDFALATFLAGLAELIALTTLCVVLIVFSRKFPHWSLFISDEQTRREKRANRIKRSAEKQKARAEQKEKRQKDKAASAAGAVDSEPQKLGRSASRMIRGKFWKNKDKKSPDPSEQSVQSESAKFYHDMAHSDNAAVLDSMQSCIGGLSSADVHDRLVKHGKNIPAKEDRFALAKYFFKALVNPFNFLLVALAVLIYTFPPPGDVIGGSIVLAMVFISVTITFIQDFRSNSAIAKLKSMVKTTTVVYRRVRSDVDGGVRSSGQNDKTVDPISVKTVTEDMTELAQRDKKDLKAANSTGGSDVTSKRIDVDVTEIVPGDIIFLTAGSVIPADVRIISCKDLFVAQSALTGESFPVEKSVNATLDEFHTEKKTTTLPLKRVKKVEKQTKADTKAEVPSARADDRKVLVESSNSRCAPASRPLPADSGVAITSEQGKPEWAEQKKSNAQDALADERFYDIGTGQAFSEENGDVPHSGRLEEDEDENDAVELSRSAVHWYMEAVEDDKETELPDAERVDTSQIHLHLDSRLRTMAPDDAARESIEPIVAGLNQSIAAAMSEHSRLRLEREDDEDASSYDEDDVNENSDSDAVKEEEEEADDTNGGELAIEVDATKAAASKDKNTQQKSASIFEHANLAFMGSSVTSGVATAVVIRTGQKTVLGELAQLLNAMKPPTSFEKGIRAYVVLMLKFMLGMGVFVTLVNGLSGKGWYEAFGFALSVAIGLTPEFLPVVITINLAKGAMDLLKRNVIVKRLICVQNLGAIEVLCTDKTGTLTDDRIQLHEYLDVDGNVQPSVLLKAAVNSSFQTAFRNMLDENVIAKAKDHQASAMEGLKMLSKVDEIPFDFNRKRMSVIVQQIETEHILICKGAAEEMIKLSSSMARFPSPAADKTLVNVNVSPPALIDDPTVRIELVDDAKRQELIAAVHKMNSQGFRVVCVAMKRMRAAAEHTYGVMDETEMTLFGFLVFLDPPKEGVEKSIESLRARGVHVKVCTGDNEKVTQYVCQRIGIPVNRILLGSEITHMSEDTLQKAVNECDIFAKLAPMDKERVVMALKANGHSVGFLGDGVNDAAALKAADVGISVDNAVEIAKESADVILLTKSLDVLDRGVLLGRRSFANIIKYIKMAASSNFGNMFSVLGLSVMLPVTPLQPVQILLNNLLYDISQIALPFDSVDEEWVAKPRQWDMKDLALFIVLIGPTSSVFDYWTWSISWYILGYQATSNQSIIQSQTIWWMESLFSQTLIVHLIRTTKIPFIQSRSSPVLIATTMLVIACSCVIPYFPGVDSIPLHSVNSNIFGWIVLEMVLYWIFTSFIKSLYYKIWPNSSC